MLQTEAIEDCSQMGQALLGCCDALGLAKQTEDPVPKLGHSSEQSFHQMQLRLRKCFLLFYVMFATLPDSRC